MQCCGRATVYATTLDAVYVTTLDADRLYTVGVRPTLHACDRLSEVN